MSTLVLAAVLFSALLHASWNALIKISGDRLVIMAIMTATSTILVIPFLILLPAPARESWPYLGFSAGVHGFYMFFLIRAYGYGDFAQIYPLARGSAPLLTAILGYFLLQESMALDEVIGMLLIVVGIFGLMLERRSGILQLSRPALFYSLLTGVSITAYSLIDGVGARLAGSTLSFTLWMFFFDGFLLPVVAYFRRPRSVLKKTIVAMWKPGLVASVTSTLGYAIIVWAFTQERIAPVAVLRETSVLFAMLISVFLIKESFSLLRMGIVFLIVGGILLLGL